MSPRTIRIIFASSILGLIGLFGLIAFVSAYEHYTTFSFLEPVSNIFERLFSVDSTTLTYIGLGVVATLTPILFVGLICLPYSDESTQRSNKRT